MKCIYFIILACFATIAEPHPLFGLNIAAGIGQLGKLLGDSLTLGLGTVANIGAGTLGLGANVVNGLANGVGNGLGMRGLAQSATRNVQQGSDQGETYNDAQEAGAYSEESHKRGQKKHHKRTHHHSRVTTITRVVDSDEHDVSSQETVEESAQDAGAFKKHAGSAAKNYGSNYEGNSQEEEN